MRLLSLHRSISSLKWLRPVSPGDLLRFLWVSLPGHTYSHLGLHRSFRAVCAQLENPQTAKKKTVCWGSSSKNSSLSFGLRWELNAAAKSFGKIFSVVQDPPYVGADGS